MATIMESLNQAVTPEVIGKIGTRIGVDSDTAQRATEIGVPLITGSIAKASSTPAGASSIFDMLGKLDPNMVGNVLGGSAPMPSTMPGAGGNMVDGLFGSALGPITSQIKQATGIDVSPFLPMLVPLVMGTIAKFAKSNNLNASSLASTLQTESRSFASSGNPMAGIVSGALNQIGSPLAAGQAAGQTAGAMAGTVAGTVAATTGSMARQAGSTVSNAANSAATTASSVAREVSAPMTSGGRPTGVTILGVLAIIGGIVSLCGGVGLLGLGGLGVLGMGAAATAGAPATAAGAVGLGAIAGLLGLGTLASGVLSLIGGIGLLGLKSWGRTLVLIGVIIGLVSAVISLINALTGGGDFLSALISLVINGVILWYLQRPDVKAAFGR